MNNPYRRFEILIPLRFNDGGLVPDELLAATLLELRRHCGAVSAETQTIQGQWQHHGEVYRDELVRVFLDVEDNEENRRFFVEFKARLKSRFHQIEIWMTSHPIDVV